MEACEKMSAAPLLASCRSLPSTFVGRPMLLRTSRGAAPPVQGIAVAQKSGLPGGTPRQSRERQRSAHQLQERAAVCALVPLGGVLRELSVQKLLELFR